eukprot:7824820-Alexandrium_andersonii.AAC.1
MQPCTRQLRAGRFRTGRVHRRDATCSRAAGAAHSSRNSTRALDPFDTVQDCGAAPQRDR